MVIRSPLRLPVSRLIKPNSLSLYSCGSSPVLGSFLWPFSGPSPACPHLICVAGTKAEDRRGLTSTAQRGIMTPYLCWGCPCRCNPESYWLALPQQHTHPSLRLGHLHYPGQPPSPADFHPRPPLIPAAAALRGQRGERQGKGRSAAPAEAVPGRAGPAVPGPGGRVCSSRAGFGLPGAALVQGERRNPPPPARLPRLQISVLLSGAWQQLRGMPCKR